MSLTLFKRRHDHPLYEAFSAPAGILNVELRKLTKLVHPFGNTFRLLITAIPSDMYVRAAESFDASRASARRAVFPPNCWTYLSLESIS